MRILFFGDSIAQGFYDKKGGWVQRIVQQYHDQSLQNLDSELTTVFNLGISGAAVEDVIDRIDDEVKTRVKEDEETIIVLVVGTNNARLNHNEAYQEIYEFQQSYEKLLKKALKLADSVLCVGLSSVDESLSNPLKQSTTGRQYLNNRIDLFEDTIKQVCVNSEVSFVPIFNTFSMAQRHTNLLADGLHPNSKGHQLIAKLVGPKLDNLTL